MPNMLGMSVGGPDWRGTGTSNGLLPSLRLGLHPMTNRLIIALELLSLEIQ